MKKSKILLCGVFCAAMFSVAAVFPACSTYDSYIDSFTGYLSENYYSTADMAASAFVSEQLTGTAFSPAYVGYETVEQLSEKEIESSAMIEQTDGDILSAERVSVTYEYSSGGEVLTESMDIDIVLQEEGYRYFALPLESGQRLTQCYLDSVMDYSNFINCTNKTTFNVMISSLGSSAYEQTIKLDYDAAYIATNLAGTGYTVEVYAQNKDSGGLKVYIKSPEISDDFCDLSKTGYILYISKGATTKSITSFATVEELSQLIFAFDYDASLFVKTNYGFMLTNDNYLQLMETVFADSDYDYSSAWEEYNMYAEAEFIFSGSDLAKIIIVVQAEYNGDIISVIAESEYYDYGSTTVTVPTVNG